MKTPLSIDTSAVLKAMKTISIDKAVMQTANNNAGELELERSTIFQTKKLKIVKTNNIIPCPILA